MIIDKIFSLLLLIIFSPIILLTSIAIFLNDGYPIFFRQKRVGRNNTHFFIYKFRTMKRNTPDIPTHLLKAKSVYISIGPFLRKYSIDELPQLLNIIKGDMRFIGPRPALHNQNDLIQLRNKKRIQSLTPGITGWAQVNGRDELSLIEKVKMDQFYLLNKSFYFDLKIIYLTILKVLTAEGVQK